MRIRINSGEQNISLLLPTNLIFSGAAAHLLAFAGNFMAEEVQEHIPMDKIGPIFRELRRIKKKYGSFELVDVETADGQKIKITL